MAVVVMPSRPGDWVIVCVYGEDAANQVRLFDEPVIAWLVDDATGLETPVIPGTLPDAISDPESPQFAYVASVQSVSGPDFAVIAPDAWRGTLKQFFSWMNTIKTPRRQLAGTFASPQMDQQFKQWAAANPGQSYVIGGGTP
jgi:hypothetical protein